MERTQDFEKAFSAIQTLTTPGCEQMHIKIKQDIVLAIRHMQLLPETLLRDFPILYVASHIDIGYPLCLGFRNIRMLDPGYCGDNSLTALISIIQDQLGIPVQRDTDPYMLHFDFDFGAGKEQVIVHCIPKCYRTPHNQQKEGMRWTGNRARALQNVFCRLHHGKNTLELYTPEEPLGMLLAYKSLKIVLKQDPYTMAKLIEGGFILSDDLRDSSNEGFKSFFLPNEILDINDYTLCQKLSSPV